MHSDAASPPAGAPSTAMARQAVLAQLELLDPDTEQVFDQIAGIAAHAARAPAALVGFLGEAGPVIKGRLGWQGDASRLRPALCAIDDMPVALHLVTDTAADARFAGRGLVEGEPQWRFYAGHPVVFAGQVIGGVCVMDQSPRRPDDDLPATLPQVLADLAALVAEVLQARHQRLLRREHEQRAADLARASGDWAWETDAEHRYCWMSPNFEECTGTPASMWFGRRVNPRALLDPWGDPLVPPTTIDQLLERREAFNGALIDTTMLQRVQVLAVSGVPRHDAEGRFLGFRGITKDVTRQIAAQRAAREQQMRQLAAEQASKNKSELLSRVSHELRTPLNAILGFSQLALLDHQQPLPRGQRRRVDAIQAGGERLLKLIDGMLDAARADQSQRTLAPTVVDLQRACSTAIALLLPLAEAHGVTLLNRLPANTLAVADESAIGQVLLNLLSNAIKYNRRGGTVRLAAMSGDALRLQIQDEGAGLSAEQVAMLFQPFNRLGAEQTAVAGTGLGLVISKTLVDAMGGSLGFESQPGAGTRVILTLPLPPSGSTAPAPLDECPPAAPDPLARAPGAQARTVLYVEDDATNAMLMRQLFLIEPAWRLDIAVTGQEGIAKSLQSPPDLILLDMNLPDMSGLDVLRTLRARGQAVPHGCIAVSADAMPHQIELAMKAGCRDYWTKPLNLADTWQRLSRLLGAEAAPAVAGSP